MHDIEAMPRRLEAFLASVTSDAVPTVRSYALMTGGYSRVMAKAEVVWSDGRTETLVLRGDPPPDQAMLKTDRDAEWELLKRLSDIQMVAMPAAMHYDATGEYLGTKAIVLEYCEGLPLQTEINALAAAGVALDDPRFLAHRDALVDTIANVTKIEASVLPAGLERPASWDSYMAAANRAWADTERRLCESNPTMRYLSAWLDAHRPPPMGLVLQHGDLQPSNILIDPADRQQQLIDWEFAHIGDPREDIGWYSLYGASAPPSLYNGDPEAFLARYRQRTGASELEINQATIGYFSIVAAVRVFGQLVEGASEMALGRNSGIMMTYNLNAATVGHMNFTNACAALAEPLDALRAAYEQLQAQGAAS